jgi:hypothetical protein
MVDISTTMLYVHHVPQHDAADRFDRALGASEDFAPLSHPTTGVVRT